MLAESVIVASNGSCPDIGIAANLSIADIGQVLSFCVFAYCRFLDFDKISDLSAWSEKGASAHM